MTEKELMKISFNNQKLAQLKNRYESEKWKSLVKGQNITGMPLSPGTSDNVGLYVTELVMLQEEIDGLQHINNLLTDKARKFIEHIPDNIIKMVLELKFINSIPDYEIHALVGHELKEKDIKNIIRTFFLDNLL